MLQTAIPTRFLFCVVEKFSFNGRDGKPVPYGIGPRGINFIIERKHMSEDCELGEQSSYAGAGRHAAADRSRR